MIKHTEIAKIKKVASYEATISGTSEAVSDADVEAGDLILAQIQTSTTSAILYKATASAGTITFLFSAAPGASTKIVYQVFKGGN